MKTVKIYSTAYCGYCRAAKQFLQEKSISVEEIDLTSDPEALMQLKQRTGMQTVPQIFIGDELIGGYQEMLELDRQGKLQPMLDDDAS